MNRRLLALGGLAAMLVAAAAASGLPPAGASPQPPGVSRTELQRHPLAMTGREAIQVRVDLAPGAEFPPHSHPGEEIVYVIVGTFEYGLEGRPPVRLGAGEVLFIPAGIVHSARNVGDVNAAELATYIVETGRPLVVPAN